MEKKPYIKNCCFFCVSREVSCLGCVIAKDGMKAIEKHCAECLKAGVCKRQFNNASENMNKNLCFTQDDRDIEELEGKKTTEIEINGKTESQIKEEAKKNGKKVEEVKEDKKEKSTDIDLPDEAGVAEALKKLAAAGKIDLNKLKEKL